LDTVVVATRVRFAEGGPLGLGGTEVARALRTGERWTILALPWWSARKDTLSLFAFLRKADDMEHRAARRGGAEFFEA